MLSFSLVAEALTGLIYQCPSGKNPNFQLQLQNVKDKGPAVQMQTDCCGSGQLPLCFISFLPPSLFIKSYDPSENQRNSCQVF